MLTESQIARCVQLGDFQSHSSLAVNHFNAIVVFLRPTEFNFISALPMEFFFNPGRLFLLHKIEAKMVPSMPLARQVLFIFLQIGAAS